VTLPGELCADLVEQEEVASNMLFSYVFATQYFSGENEYEPIQSDYKMINIGRGYESSFWTRLELGINYA